MITTLPPGLTPLTLQVGGAATVQTPKAGGDRLAYERSETEALLGAQPIRQPSRINDDLALSHWLVFLRRLPDGKVALQAHLPQDVTHLEITVTSGSGAARTFVVPKDEDLEAKRLLGNLSDGTKVTVTPLRSGPPEGPERGPALELTWSLKTRPSPNVQTYLRDLEQILANADQLGPAGISERLTELSDRFLSWPGADHLYLWSDAGSASRKQLMEVYERLAAHHPDLEVRGVLTEHEKTLSKDEQEQIIRSRTATLRTLVENGRAAEAAWVKQAEDLAAALR